MLMNGRGDIFCRAQYSCLAIFLAFSSLALLASGQSAERNRYYSRLNSFGFSVGYSGDSSHMLIGNADQRKLLLIGASYTRRLKLGRLVSWQYNAEILPVALESDPLSLYVNNQTLPIQKTFVTPGGPPNSCSPVTVGYNFPGPNGETYAGTAITYCHGRRWTMGEAMSPIGFQWNFLPTRKLQPFLAFHGGDMFSSRDIPMNGAGSFNFTFDFDTGFELYSSRTRSIRFGCRYHHISNDHTAQLNPGIDNGLFQVSYTFGR